MSGVENRVFSVRIQRKGRSRSAIFDLDIEFYHMDHIWGYRDDKHFILLPSVILKNKSRSPIVELDMDFHEVYHWY